MIEIIGNCYKSKARESSELQYTDEQTHAIIESFGGFLLAVA
jgi:hypothetical protein